MTKTYEFLIEDEDLEWLQENFPELTYVRSRPSTISGMLAFGMEYYPAMKSFDVLQFSETAKSKDNLIYDSYKIEIELQKSMGTIWPKVFETGNRIPRMADYHCYPDGLLCLTTPFEEAIYSKDGFNLKEFLTNIVVPSLYEQSYYQKYGEWPWGEYSHGVNGLLESFGNNYKELSFYQKLDALYKISQEKLLDIYLNRNDNPYSLLCPCGSCKKFQACHIKAFKGYLMLKRFRDNVIQNPTSRQLAVTYFDPKNIIMIQGWRQ